MIEIPLKPYTGHPEPWELRAERTSRGVIRQGQLPPCGGLRASSLGPADPGQWFEERKDRRTGQGWKTEAPEPG